MIWAVNFELGGEGIAECMNERTVGLEAMMRERDVDDDDGNVSYAVDVYVFYFR